jgi:adenylosuccinate lyase
MNISPIDNRYKFICEPLNEYVSDYGINKIRCEVEIEYFILLLKDLLQLNYSENDYNLLRAIYNNFNSDDLNIIKNIESTTNHDIKALEYFIKNKLSNIKNKQLNIFDKYSEYVHFSLTSQDINSVTNSLVIKHSSNNILIPKLGEMTNILKQLSKKWNNNYMISKTHGQSATTTSMGKEIYVYYDRLNIQLEKLKNIKYSTKFGGAVGNLNAHYFCYPEYDWDLNLTNFLIDTFDLKRNQFTTQIDHYDNLCEVFDIYKRINTILLDLNQDIWLYISNNYFKLKVNSNETGSSTMPHKVNPINFENSEGNIYLANSLLNMFSSKLPISRLQRDLTDSTITRNIGSAFSYCLIAYSSLIKGLNKLELNMNTISNDLDNNWCILMEPLQSVMKTELIYDSYEIIKNLSRNKTITKEDYIEIVSRLDISTTNRQKLLLLTPSTYIGILNRIKL